LKARPKALGSLNPQASAGGWNGGVQAGDGDSVTLSNLVVAYFDGVATKSFVELDSVVTRDFLIYEDGRVWNNDSVFYNIQYHQPFTVKFTLTDFRVFTDTRSGEVRYHSQADFVVADTIRFTLDFLETALCRKTAAGWKISLIHVTGEKPPAVNMPGYYLKYDSVRYIPQQGVPVGMIAGNITSMVQYLRVRSPGARVYVVSVLPTNDRAREDYPEIAGKNKVVRELDGRLREEAGDFGYEYIDLASRVTDGVANLDARYAKPDGLHLNEAGYGVLVKLLKEKGYL
jgi:hypothetical protein